MSDVQRFWCHEASNIRCVREADFNRVAAENQALQQRLTTADQRIDELEQALKFYAEREHYHFESGNWDTVSGEPLNILWCGDEPDFIEDGSVARAALSASLGQCQTPKWVDCPGDGVSACKKCPGTSTGAAPAKS
ncbi:hypothetical protein BK652_10005 [Pseudomonas brassicacearum]|uniref:Uncharacterized protein n=1 Tax=Pseudomonas brassicacearum TaxID=930166 RepID=A0A423GDJ4_9PSED|nr:hypothetical protein [Pseudomonas brassicacearum]ROM84902.1 hypothetical protein BK652_10005 [Pseudomonas brassicacearum]